MKYIYKLSFKPVFEGDPEPDPKPEPETKTFTQDQVNAILAEDKRKHQAEVSKALERVRALEQKTNMSEEERTEYEKSIEDLNKTILTKEELAARALDKEKNAHKEALKESQGQTMEWQTRYTNAEISRSITDAAVVYDALNPAHIAAILRPQTQLTEDTKDGEKLGTFTPMVNFADKDKDGNNVTLTLPVADAVKRMTEITEHQNLFKGNGTGGLGSDNKTPIGDKDIKELASDPAAYKKARLAGKVDLT